MIPDNVKIIRKNKKTIRIEYNSEQYLINNYGVICYETTLPTGKKWYNVGGELNRIMNESEKQQFIRAIADKVEW